MPRRREVFPTPRRRGAALAPRRRALLLAPLALLPALPSCGADAAATAVAVVDTLPGGGIHVRSTAEGAWAIRGGEPWELVERVRIGRIDGDDPSVFGRVGAVIEDALGRVWVVDAQAYEVRVFDRNGQFVRTIGRQGEGPGEFGGFSGPCAFPGPAGHVIVEDRLGRWQRFDTAGVLVSTQRSTSTVGCGVRVLTNDDRLMAVASGRSTSTPSGSPHFVAHVSGPDHELIPADTIPFPQGPEMPRVTWVSGDGRRIISNLLPFWPRTFRMLGADGNFWGTDGNGYTILKLTPAEDTLLLLEKPHESIPVPDSARARAIDELRPEGMQPRDGFDPDRVPHVYPPFEQLMEASDGTLWVLRTLGPGMPGLDVFSPDGVYLGPVRLPPDFGSITIRRITGNDVYGVATDELGVQYVVRFEIRKSAG